jgi:polyhydroxybutyrate depolymerase
VPDSTTVERRRYTGCRTGGETVFYAILGGGHVWPGSPYDLPLLGCTTRDMSASALILAFFSDGAYVAPPPPPNAKQGCEKPVE